MRTFSPIPPVLLSAWLLLAATAAWAQAPQVWADGYTLRHWTTDDGLPTHTVLALAHDRHGFLWLATNDGLVRFDGIEVEVFNRNTTEALPVNRFDQIVAGADGRVTFAAAKRHFVQYHERTFRRFPSTPRANRVALVEGDTIWVGGDDGLYRVTPDAATPYRPDVIPSAVTSLYRDGDGSLWVGTHANGLLRLAPDGSLQTYGPTEGLPSPDVLALAGGPGGGLWLMTPTALVQRTGNTFTVRATWATPAYDSGALLPTLHVGAQGKAWMRSPAWLPTLLRHNDHRLRVWSPETHTLTRWQPTTGSAEYVRTVYADAEDATWVVEQHEVASTLYRDGERFADVPALVRELHRGPEGNLWLASTNGLYQLRPRPVAALAPRLDDRRPTFYGMAEAADGALLAPVVNQQRLLRITPTAITSESLRGIFYRAIFLTSDGTRWLGGDFCRYEAGTCPPVTAGPSGTRLRGVLAALEDEAGRFWVGAQDTLWQGRADQPAASWVAHPLPVEDRIQRIYETPGGDLLLATRTSGIAQFLSPAPPDAPARFQYLDESHGLASNHVRDLYQDEDRILWIATGDNGLCRLDRKAHAALPDGDLRCLGVADGLPTPSLHRILPDDHGRLWFNSNQGLFWIARTDLDAWATGEHRMVSSVVYTEADGMPIREGNGGVQNAGLRAQDGTLYFPTMTGLAVIDPARLPSPDAPTPYIRSVRIGSDHQAPTPALTLPPDQRNLALTFTAPAFTKPESVLFEYRLLGFDDAWQMADSRTATYTNLPPGRYRFEVRAGIGGQWSAATSQPFVREAHFWETRLFWVTMGLLGLGLFVYAYWQKQQQAVRLQQAVVARTAELQATNTALRASTDRIAKQAEDLQRAATLKTRFLTNISHEFRTPLTLTFGPIDDLLHGQFSSLDEARPHFNRARRNGSRLLRLINQLLDLSQLGAGATRLTPRRDDLAAFLHGVIAPFLSLAERRRIRLDLDLPDAPLPFVFDADAVDKITVNLLSNAFKFTDQGGTITLRLTAGPDADFAVLEVADTGTGIPAEHQPRLFERFYQVDDGPTRPHEGSGVGLALVKELATLHGGSVEVESVPGEGSRFVVRLAQLEADTEAAPAVEEIPQVNVPPVQLAPNDLAASAAEDTAQPVILVAEDNPDMRSYLVAHLTPHYQILEAVDGQEGLTQAQAEVPDLVLTDVMMPRLDGLGLCAALKQDRRTSHIPILMLSAKADVASRITGYETGADAYLPKPFDARELRARVQALLTERTRLWQSHRATQPQPADAPPLPTDEAPAAPALPPAEQAFLDELDAHLTTEFSRPDLTLSDIAEALHLSDRQLRRKVTALTGASPSDRLRHLRLAHARDLLRAGTHTVKQVAFAVGYKNESAFSRAFSQHFGTAPSSLLPGNPAPIADA